MYCTLVHCIKIQNHQCLWKPCAGNATKKFDSCNLLFHRRDGHQRKSKTQSRKPNTKCATVNVEDFIFVLIDSAVAEVISSALRRNKEFPICNHLMTFRYRDVGLNLRDPANTGVSSRNLVLAF